MEKLLERLKALGAKDEELALAKEELQEYLDLEVTGLKAKNVELIKKLKVARAGDGSVDVAAMEEKVEGLEAKLADAGREKDRLTREYARKEKELVAKADGESAAVARLIVEGGLKESLSKLGIKAQQIPYLVAGLKSKVSIKIDGDQRLAEIEGKSLGEYLEKTWAVSEEGKAFVPARSSGGIPLGGASPSGKEPPKTILRTEWNSLDAEAKMQFVKDGGKVADP